MVSRFLIVFLLLTGAAFSQSFVEFVDGYYGYNFNKPVSGKNLYRNFDFNHNQFSLNYAELAIEQKPGPEGFRADIGFGDAATWVHTSERGEYRYDWSEGETNDEMEMASLNSSVPDTERRCLHGKGAECQDHAGGRAHR